MQRVPAWLLVALSVAGGRPALGAEAAKPAAEPEMTVVNVSSHCDWAWGHSRAWHAARYAETIRNVLLLMRDHPGYVWQLETANEQLAPFLERARQEWPEMVDEFWQRVRQGRIEVLVAISNPRLTEIYPETLLRNLVLGKQYFRRHAPGIRQEVYNAVDLMCGSSQMPQILSKAEYRYFMFSRPVDQQVTFWRKGLDGTRMLSSRSFYGSGAMGTFGKPCKGIRPVSVWRLALGGDDALPDAALPKQAAAWDPNKKILSTVARYFEEVERRGDQVTEMEGVLDSLEFYHSAGTHGNRNLFVRNNRNEDLLLSAEKAQVMASLPAGSPPAEKMDPLWRDLLSCTGHAILWLWKDDYQERLDQARRTHALGRHALHEALGAITQQVRFRPKLGRPLMVFSFHGWPATGPVEFLLEGDPAGVVLRDGQGKAVPVQAAGARRSGGLPVAFIAEGVPACGYKTFYLNRAEKEAGPAQPELAEGPGTIENDRFRIGVQLDGKLEVFDKARSVMLGKEEHGGLGDVVFYDAPTPKNWQMNGPLGPRHDWSPDSKALRACRGPVFGSLWTGGKLGPHALTRQVRLYRASRRIDYLVGIDAGDGCGVFCIRFPVGIDGRVTAGIPFGAEPREDFDRQPFRGEYFVRGCPEGYYAMRWTDVSTPELGYTFACPAGMYTGYAWRAKEQALEFILHRVRPMPQGAWGQVSPSVAGKGRHRWHCALVPHQGTWRQSASYRDALELHVPLLAFSPYLGAGRGSADGKQPPGGNQRDDAASFAEVDPAGVVLSALRLVAPEKDSQTPRWELRLYETTGQAADVVVRLGYPIAAVQETNLLGRPTDELGGIQVEGNQLRFHILPWKIATLRVTPGTAAPGK